MKIGEPTLDELGARARADLAKGGTDVALEWAFRHAKAVARLARAEMAAKAHEADRLRMQINFPEAGYDPVTLNLIAAPMRGDIDALLHATASLHADAIDVAEARACEAFCEHVWQLAARTPRQQQPAAKPKAA